MSLKARLWSGSAMPVSVFMAVSWTWSGMATSETFVVSCGGSWRRYLMWTTHDNVIIFITLVAPNMRAISCYMSLFLALEIAIFFVQHHIDCGRWDDCSCELLCSIKLLHFWDGISEHLRSLFIDVDSQSFHKDSDGSSIICEVASFSLCLKPVDICCKGFLFPLLDLHGTWRIGMDVSTAKFEP